VCKALENMDATTSFQVAARFASGWNIAFYGQFVKTFFETYVQALRILGVKPVSTHL
jgi:hypothetical protein